MTHRNKWLVFALVVQASLSALSSSALLTTFTSPLIVAAVMAANAMLGSGIAAWTAATSPVREVSKEGVEAASAAYHAAATAAPDVGPASLPPHD